jgi:hypothetical protein
MKHKITIQEITEDSKSYGTSIYGQIITDLDVDAVIRAANKIASDNKK